MLPSAAAGPTMYTHAQVHVSKTNTFKDRLALFNKDKDVTLKGSPFIIRPPDKSLRSAPPAPPAVHCNQTATNTTAKACRILPC